MTLESIFTQFVYGTAFGSGLIVTATLFKLVGWGFC
jgi:hypothetical protein